MNAPVLNPYHPELTSLPDLNLAKDKDSILMDMSQEIKMGCWWYGWIEPYLEMNL
jgi:hypothetical protein